jgi:hypothetical protein
MLVRMRFGSRRGEVMDFLPHEARAMLADGRAELPELAHAAAAQPERVVPDAGDLPRMDRGMPRGRPRRAR